METREKDALVSVIIPIYNVEEYIEKCVESIQKQTWKDVEIVCVNDGTPDHSMDIVHRLAENDARIKIVNKENGGLSRARNTGMQHATGKYICFLDSDDYLALDAIEKLVVCSEKNNTDIVFFGAETIFENEELAKQQSGYATYYKRKTDYAGVYSGEGLFIRMVNSYDFKPSACMIFINREFLSKIGVEFYPGILHEDNLFTMQLMKSAARAMVLDEPFYKRLVREGSITSGEKSVKHAYGFFVCQREILEYIGKWGYSMEFFTALMKHFENMKKNALKNLAEMNFEHILMQIMKLEPEEAGYFMEYIYELKKAQMAPKPAPKVETKPAPAKVENKPAVQPAAKPVVKKPVPKKEGIKAKLKKNKHVAKLVRKFRNLMKRIDRSTLGAFRWFRDTIQQFGFGYFTYRRSLKKNPNKICVSVIMPVYNVEKYLPAALDSLINQNLKNIEIICVDDCSTDSSWSILQEYSKKDSRIKIFQQPKGGAGAARNYGMKEAKGEYLLFLDSDDLFKDSLCNEVYYQCIRMNADVCLFAAQRMDMQTMKKEPMGWVFRAADIPQSNLFSGKDVSDKIFQLASGCPWSKMFRREYIMEKGLQFQNLPNANDAYFVRVGMALADRITSLNRVYVTYRYNEGNNIQSNKSKAPTAFYEAYKAIKLELQARGVYEQYEQSFCNMALTESLANLRTMKTEEAKETIYNLLRDEGIEFFEFLKHEESYYSKKQDYQEIKAIMETKKNDAQEA